MYTIDNCNNEIEAISKIIARNHMISIERAEKSLYNIIYDRTVYKCKSFYIPYYIIICQCVNNDKYNVFFQYTP